MSYSDDAMADMARNIEILTGRIEHAEETANRANERSVVLEEKIEEISATLINTMNRNDTAHEKIVSTIKEFVEKSVA